MSCIFQRFLFLPASQCIAHITLLFLFFLYVISFKIEFLIPIFILVYATGLTFVLMMSMLWKASKFNGNDPADLLIGDRRKLTIETIGIIVFSMFVIVITWNGIKTAENHYIILMAIILTVVLTSGEGTRFGIEYNILIFIPLLSVPLVYKVLITYSNLPKSATNITVLSIQTIIYCLIDICLIWRSNLKPLKLWMNLTKEIKNPLTVNPSNCLVRATGGTSTHTLFNEGTKRIIFKIKSSNNKDYRITPVFGFINPSEKKKLTVIRTSGERKNDKLVIHFGYAPEDATDAQATFPNVTPFGSVTILLWTN